MGYWMFLFVCNLLIPVTMILVERRYYKKPPKEIDSLSGYRTTRSMQNQENWIYANTYIGKLWWKVGWILIIPTALAQLTFANSSTNKIGILSLTIVSVQCWLCYWLSFRQKELSRKILTKTPQLDK